MNSRLPGFHRLPRNERLARIGELVGFDGPETQQLGAADSLPTETAEALSENVLGIFGLPLGVAVNFRVDGVDRLVPMAIEESSVVAAASNAARLLRDGQGGRGIEVQADEPLMVGQIQILDVPDIEAATHRLQRAEAEIVSECNERHQLLTAAGGGARRIEIHHHPETPAGPMLVVHLLVDVADAMGANAINSMCEALAPKIEAWTEGRVALRILSNLCDRRLVRATGSVGAELPPAVKRGIAEASAFASVDPYRAVTHNKGILNGVDAVVLATGNDWRGVECAAHAFAARSGIYRPLATWEIDATGNLAGNLEMPMPVGVVGGATKAHPQAARALRIAGARSGRDLAGLIGAVGLAQNLAALRALATEGIQQGHMSLHARNVAIEAGATGPEIEQVASRMVADGRVGASPAREFLSQLRAESPEH